MNDLSDGRSERSKGSRWLERLAILVIGIGLGVGLDYVSVRGPRGASIAPSSPSDERQTEQGADPQPTISKHSQPNADAPVLRIWDLGRIPQGKQDMVKDYFIFVGKARQLRIISSSADDDTIGLAYCTPAQHAIIEQVFRPALDGNPF